MSAETLRTLKLGIDPSHGTRSRYVLGCRCDDCRRANREKVRARDLEARAAVAHLPLNPGGLCPGFDGVPCRNARRLKSNSAALCKECLTKAAWNGLVDARPVRRHLRELSRQGVGYKSVADAADVGRSTLQKVMSGEKKRIRKRAADRVLEVTADARADGGLVPAGETREILRMLVPEFLTKGRLARELGAKTDAIQIGRTAHVRARTAYRVRKLRERVVGDEATG